MNRIDQLESDLLRVGIDLMNQEEGFRKAREEIARLKETNTRLHRRAQTAESISNNYLSVILRRLCKLDKRQALIEEHIKSEQTRRSLCYHIWRILVR